VRRAIDEVFSQRWFALDAVECARLLGINAEACERILRQLEEAGLIRETRPGMWMRPAHVS
jgi:DNA-binding Lrp family transcriptional regulator